MYPDGQNICLDTWIGSNSPQLAAVEMMAKSSGIAGVQFKQTLFTGIGNVNRSI